MKTAALLLLASLPLGALLAGCSTAQERGPYADIPLGNLDTGRLVLADYEHGKHYLASGDYGLAIDSFEKALAQSPGSADAMNGLAIAYDRIGRKDDAAMFLNKALALDPRSAYTLNNFAYFHLSHGERDQAMAYFARAKAALSAAPESETSRTLPTIVANNFAAIPTSEPAAQNMVSDRAKAAPAPTRESMAARIPVASDAAPFIASLTATAKTTPDVSFVPGKASIAQSALAEIPATAQPAIPHRDSVMRTQTATLETSTLNHATLRIANLTGRPHMARRFARYLDGQGMTAHHLIDVRYDNRQRSAIYYSRGQEEAAKALARLVPVPVRMFGLSNDYRTVELMLAPDLEEFDRTLLSSPKAST